MQHWVPLILRVHIIMLNIVLKPLDRGMERAHQSAAQYLCRVPCQRVEAADSPNAAGGRPL